jgi:hypothetical protein
VTLLPNCAVDCRTLCQMSTHGYCQRPKLAGLLPGVKGDGSAGNPFVLLQPTPARPPGGWSDSGPVEGQ